jgi:hypothetical protein
MSNLYRGPSKDASYQVLIHLAKRLQRRRFFRNQPIRNKNCLWGPCSLTDRDEMSNLYWGHDIDASYQVSIHFAKRFQRRRFLKISQSETRIAYGSHVCKMNWNMVGSIIGRSSYKDCWFSSDPLTNMTATDNSCFWLVDFLKKLLLWSHFAKWIITW